MNKKIEQRQTRTFFPITSSFLTVGILLCVMNYNKKTRFVKNWKCFVSISISAIRETSDQLKSVAPVPLHPKPMVEGGRVLARMEGNRRFDKSHFHN
jgi:hypothetical protein